MKCLLSYCCFLVFFVGIFASCKKPQALQYVDFQHFQVSEITKGRSDLSADLKFYNPNPYKLRLKSAEMNFYVNDQYFGKSVLDTLMEIPKRDTFLVPVSIKEVELKKVLLNGLGALLTQEYNIRLDGKAKIGKAGFYFTFPLHYEGKQRLDLFK
ncbi:MAG: LEA type 2 family protein [Williamsia sp.]|nr:LEA type 2 family protein [Williamsia sp.]